MIYMKGKIKGGKNDRKRTKRMLNINLDIKIISEITGLTIEEINNLK